MMTTQRIRTFCSDDDNCFIFTAAREEILLFVFSATDAVFDGNTSVNFTVVLPPVFFVICAFSRWLLFCRDFDIKSIRTPSCRCKTSSHSSQVDREEDFVG